MKDYIRPLIMDKLLEIKKNLDVQSQLNSEDLIEALESPITIVDYSKNTEVLLSFWKKIEGNFKELFNNTLEDLVKEEDLIRKRIDFQI